MIAPRAARRRRDRRARGADAPARPAPRRPARAARRQPRPARSGCAELRRAPRARRRCARRPPPSLDYAERRTRALPGASSTDGVREARDVLEGARGRPRAARCTATVERRRADRSTSPAAPTQHAGNLNCPLAVTRSACYFAVRVLTDPDIPPSAGAHAARRRCIAPEGSLLNARSPGRGRRRQRRDLLARRRPRARRRSAARSARAR